MALRRLAERLDMVDAVGPALAPACGFVREELCHHSTSLAALFDDERVPLVAKALYAALRESCSREVVGQLAAEARRERGRAGPNRRRALPPKGGPRVPPRILQTISPNDWTYREDPDRYHLWGRTAVRVVQQALLCAGVAECRRVLDYGCGYGRVTRYLNIAFPTATLVAWDPDEEAERFCAQTFGARRSRELVDAAVADGADRFDVIWCGSVLRHLDRAAWRTCLNALIERLAPRGVLVFTTHGRWVAEELRRTTAAAGTTGDVDGFLRAFDSTGFGHRLGNHGRGESLACAAWVLTLLQTWPQLRAVSVVERGWAAHEDVFAFVRTESTPHE